MRKIIVGRARPGSVAALCGMVLICSLTPKLIIAAEPEKQAEPVPQTVEIIGTPAGSQRQNDIGGKITINRDEITKHGDANLAEVLRRQQGVSVVGSEIRLRGLGNGYTQILVNGDPVSVGFSIDGLSPDSIERIEILRSGTAEFSAQAIAGTINFVLRKSVAKGSRKIKMGLARSETHTSPNVTIEMADKNAGFSYLLTGNVRLGNSADDRFTTELLDDANGGTVTLRQFNEHFIRDSKRFNLGPRLNWSLANGDQITWQSLLMVTHINFAGKAMENTLQGQPSSYPINDSLTKFKTYGVTSNVNWEHRFSPDIKLDTKIGIEYNKRDKYLFFNGYTNQSQQPFIRNTNFDQSEQNYTATGKILWRYNDSQSVKFGWDGGFVHNNELRKQYEQDASGIGRAAVPEDFVAEIRQLALFAQDEWDVSKSLQAYLGIRWEGLRTRVRGNSIVGVDSKSSVFSPVLQALWTLPGTEKDQLRLAFSRTYKAPTPRDLAPHRQIMNNDNGPNNPDYQGNPDLLPELATGLDLSYDHYFAKDGTLSISGFMRRIQNITVNRVIFDNGTWIASQANQGVGQVRGVEFDAKLPIGMFFENAPAIELRLNAARNWSRLESVTGPDNRVANQVPVTANFGLDYKRTETHSMGFNFNFQNSGRIKISETQSSYGNVSRTLDIFSVWNLSKATQLRVSIGDTFHQHAVTTQTYRALGEYRFRSTITPSDYTLKLMLEHAL